MGRCCSTERGTAGTDDDEAIEGLVLLRKGAESLPALTWSSQDPRIE